MGSLVDAYSAFAVDLDGVVWRGLKILDGAADGIAAIRRAKKPLLLVTNNAAYSPNSVVERLKDAGIEVSVSEILTTAVVAREWIVARGLEGSRAMILAGREVIVQFEDLIDVIPAEPGQRDVPLILVGRDTTFDYLKLSAAAAAAAAGGWLVAFNRDAMFPTEKGLEPGTGPLVRAIETAAGVEAVSLGKPDLPMMDHAARILGRSGVLMVGDRPDSDVAGAHSIGWKAALVLSGVTSSAEGLEPRPDHVIGSIGELA